MLTSIGRFRGAAADWLWWWWIDPRRVERLVIGVALVTVLLLGASSIMDLWVRDTESALRAASLWFLLVVSCAALLFTPRNPAVAGVLATAPFLWLLVEGRWLGAWLVAQLVVVSLAAVRSWRLAVLPALGGLVAVVLVASRDTRILTAGNRSRQDALTFSENHSWTWQQFSLLVAALVVPAAIGLLARTALKQRTLTHREAALGREGRMQSERARLAADLHDVVAHNVSLIAVRAETAPYSSPGMDAESRTVLGEIADDARRALGELRGVLGVLHRADASPELAPQPGMNDLPELVLRSTRAGDRIVAEGIDAAWIVPETVGYVVYRVVQESLTNARRHAHGGRVELRLERDDGEVVVTVSNEPGRSTVSPGQESGAGILGMAERVEALDGVLVAGPTAGGGFTVTARLPLDPR